MVQYHKQTKMLLSWWMYPQHPWQCLSLCKAWQKEANSERILQSRGIQKRSRVCVSSTVQKWNLAAVRGAPTGLWREEYVEVIDHFMRLVGNSSSSTVPFFWCRINWLDIYHHSVTWQCSVIKPYIMVKNHNRNLPPPFQPKLPNSTKVETDPKSQSVHKHNETPGIDLMRHLKL